MDGVYIDGLYTEGFIFKDIGNGLIHIWDTNT